VTQLTRLFENGQYHLISRAAFSPQTLRRP